MYTYIPSFGGFDTKSKRLFICLVIHLFFVSLSSLSAPPGKKRTFVYFIHYLFLVGDGNQVICLSFTWKEKIGRRRTRGQLVSCLDFSVVGMGQLVSRQELDPCSNMAMGLDQEWFVEAPFSTKSYPNLSRLRLHWKVSPSYPQGTNGA